MCESAAGLCSLRPSRYGEQVTQALHATLGRGRVAQVVRCLAATRSCNRKKLLRRKFTRHGPESQRLPLHPRKQFVDSQISLGRYSRVSEYVRELIRADERRKAFEQLEAKLLEGLNSAESELTPADWSAIREEALAQVEARKKRADAGCYPARSGQLKVTDARQPYPLSWDEQASLFAELPGHVARMALFKVNTGTRDKEVSNLRWEWEVQVPELRTSVFIIPGLRVKNGEEPLGVLNRIASSVIESVRGEHREFIFTLRGRAVTMVNNTA